MPSAGAKRSSLAAIAEASNIKLQWSDGVRPEDIDLDTLPPGTNGRPHSLMRGYALGAWQAHMNALDKIINARLATAVIAEDDIDWDVRIKVQMRSAALALQALVQPLRSHGHALPETMRFESLPHVAPPLTSPYGDEWDVLWLGNCRMVIETGTPYTNHKVVRSPDTSVPTKLHLEHMGFDGHDIVLNDFPEHTRFYHHVKDGLCSLLYAVSLEGAKRIRHEFGNVMLNAPFDVMLMQYCNTGGRPDRGAKAPLRCLTVSPQLFSGYHPDRRSSDTIRWSARVNLKTLRSMNGTFPAFYEDYAWEDSFPD